MSDNEIVPKWQTPNIAEEIFDCATSASMAETTSRVLLKYWKIGLIRPIGDTERYGIYFDLEAVFLTRQAERLRQEFSIDMKTASIIVKLRQENEMLREELKFWRK